MTKKLWAIDEAHTSVEFSVRHMMVAKVKGVFTSFTADISADPSDLTTAEIEFNVDLNSIDTRNSDRDNHLRSADFFDVDNHPQMTFKATKIVKTDDDEYEMTGDLTILGITKTEKFKVTYEGQGKDPWGNLKVGFSAKGSIDRSDYGMVFNSALETGGVMIGEKVKINLDIEAVE